MADPTDPVEVIRERWSRPWADTASAWPASPARSWMDARNDVHALLLRVDGLTEQLRAEQAMHRKELNELHREHARDIRDACAQARDDAAYDAREREGGY